MKTKSKDVVANTLITTSDIALIIIASLLVSFAFIGLSMVSEFVRTYDLLIFTLFEIVAFVCVLCYKRCKK